MICKQQTDFVKLNPRQLKGMTGTSPPELKLYPPITLNVPSVSGDLLSNSPDFIEKSSYTYSYIHRLKCTFECLLRSQVLDPAELRARVLTS